MSLFFRHTHASLLFESGATLKEVQTRLSHSDIKTTMDIYTHITQSSREKLAEKFQNHINF
ncbi:integrase [Staphylococcus lutrae]|uniref:Integrase n=1 Tax=Staphylococcus lutrae TaxID=155085 RepID=A0AAC9RRH6_9STAP|nr:integrase [Staphylococcus lutrae]PNZ34901.1 integrase [Staphylococcus lutrae]